MPTTKATPAYGAHALIHPMDFTLELPAEVNITSLYPNSESTRLASFLRRAAEHQQLPGMTNMVVDAFEQSIAPLSDADKQKAWDRRRRLAAICKGELEPTPEEVVEVATETVVANIPFVNDKWCGLTKHQLRLILPFMAHWCQVPRESPYIVLVKRKLAVIISKIFANGFTYTRYQSPIDAMPDLPEPGPVVAGIVARDASPSKAAMRKKKTLDKQAWREGEFSGLGKRKFHEYHEPAVANSEDEEDDPATSPRSKARKVGRPVFMHIAPRLLLPSVSFLDRHKQPLSEEFISYRKDIIPTYAQHLVDIDRHSANTAAAHNEDILLRHMRTVLYIDHCDRAGIPVPQARRDTLPLPKRYFKKNEDGSFRLGNDGQRIQILPDPDPYKRAYDVEGLRLVVPIFAVDTQAKVLRMMMDILKNLKDNVGAESAQAAGYADEPSEADIRELPGMFNAFAVERQA